MPSYFLSYSLSSMLSIVVFCFSFFFFFSLLNKYPSPYVILPDFLDVDKSFFDLILKSSVYSWLREKTFYKTLEYLNTGPLKMGAVTTRHLTQIECMTSSRVDAELSGSEGVISRECIQSGGILIFILWCGRKALFRGPLLDVFWKWRMAWGGGFVLWRL